MLNYFFNIWLAALSLKKNTGIEDIANLVTDEATKKRGEYKNKQIANYRCL